MKKIVCTGIYETSHIFMFKHQMTLMEKGLWDISSALEMTPQTPSKQS